MKKRGGRGGVCPGEGESLQGRWGYGEWAGLGAWVEKGSSINAVRLRGAWASEDE